MDAGGGHDRAIRGITERGAYGRRRLGNLKRDWQKLEGRIRFQFMKNVIQGSSDPAAAYQRGDFKQCDRAHRNGFLTPRNFIEDAVDRKSTRLNSSHIQKSRMPSSA